MTARSFFATFYFGISLLFGAVALWQWGHQTTWRPVRAEVVQGGTRTLMQPPMEGKYGTHPPRKMEIPWVRYSYVVNGQTYFGKASGSTGGLSVFTAYYDPARPERSRIKAPEHPGSLWTGATAALFCLAGAGVALGGRRRQETHRTRIV